jgi:hypothetical protein
MKITPATAGDLENLIAFRDEASRWLRARGIDRGRAPGHPRT